MNCRRELTWKLNWISMWVSGFIAAASRKSSTKDIWCSCKLSHSRSEIHLCSLFQDRFPGLDFQHLFQSAVFVDVFWDTVFSLLCQIAVLWDCFKTSFSRCFSRALFCEMHFRVVLTAVACVASAVLMLSVSELKSHIYFTSVPVYRHKSQYQVTSLLCFLMHRRIKLLGKCKENI